MSIQITHFMRDRRAHARSIERVYEDVRAAIPDDCTVVEWVCKNPSKGLIGRLQDAWNARRAQTRVNHVTGDTHYLTFFLTPKRTVLTIHDLGSFQNSKGVRRFILYWFWFWIPIKLVRIVVVVSERTRRVLLDAIKCDPRKVVVVHNPVSDEFQPYPKPFNSSQPRILQVGTAPNKNLGRVIEAVAGLECKLIIIGALSSEQKEMLDQHEIEYENHVGLSRSALLSQYIDSDILMFSSTYEGFGLPIVEGNAVGRPVITSTLEPMREVAADAACLVDPYDVDAIRAGVIRVMNDNSYREGLILAGYRNAQKFRAAVVAAKYAEIYRKITQ